MVENNLDSIKAREIAMRFLQQNHSVHRVENAILEDGSWQVKADVTSFGIRHIKRVKIDDASGRIISIESVEFNPRNSQSSNPDTTQSPN